jgi:hypothetical protein
MARTPKPRVKFTMPVKNCLEVEYKHRRMTPEEFLAMVKREQGADLKAREPTP